MKKTLEIFKAAREKGLSMSGLWVLVLLDEHGPLAMTALCRHLAVTSAAMTGIIDSLGDGGLVRRGPQAGDRRVIMVSMTDEGAALVTGKQMEVVR